MIKILHNNLMIDVCPRAIFLRYVPEIKRYIATNVQNANAILGSDQNTTYHLLNTDYNFDEEKQSVVYKEITESEYEQLSKQISVQKQQEMEELKQEVGNLKQMLAQQNILIQQLISRLN